MASDTVRAPSGQALSPSATEPVSVSARSGDGPSRDDLTCSFCGKSQHDVAKLIAGPCAFICDECVDLCTEIIGEERRPVGNQRAVKCPGCGERISMVAAVGREQRWGIEVKPGPSGLLQAKTISGVIDAAQKMMRASCREDGANVQTYVESISTSDDGTVSIGFATLPTSKKCRDSDGSPKGGDGEAGSVRDSADPQGYRPTLIEHIGGPMTTQTVDAATSMTYPVVTQADTNAAMKLLLGEKVGGGDGNTYVLRQPTVSVAAAAFARHRLEGERAGMEKAAKHVRDFRWRASQCRTNLDAFDTKAAAIWDLAADALEGK